MRDSAPQPISRSPRSIYLAWLGIRSAGYQCSRHPMDHGVTRESLATMGNGRIDVWHSQGWIFIADTVRACVGARHDLHVRIGA